MEPTSYDLSLEQQFQIKLMEESAQSMTREQALELLIQASRLLMLKDNVIKGLVKQLPMPSLSFEG
jgi:hypothetical protein